jgi:hypothetical protein
MRLVNMQNQDPLVHFEDLLDWLDSDRERAAEKYESIRKSLIQIFIWKGFSEAESLADETLNRVMLRVPEIRETYMGNPSLYIHGVAKKVLAEHMRARSARRETLVRANPKTTDINNEKITTRYQTLIDRKYERGLSPSENEELAGLKATLDEMDEPYYHVIIKRLHRLVEERGV